MKLTRHTISMVNFSVILIVFLISGNVYGKSLYAITKCSGGTLTAYDIQGEQIDYQEDLDIGSGSVGLALDPDSATLFATYDFDLSGENKIVLINAKTMKKIKSMSVSDELAGIVYDQSRKRVYAVSRQDKFLYIYSWNPVSKSLTIEDIITLLNISNEYGAYGLALNEDNDVLYVTDKTDTVKYYDVNDDFEYKGPIDVDETAVGIDFYSDGQDNKYLYTGRYSHTSGDHFYLVRTDITDVNNPVSTKRDLDNFVSGIAADRQTGLIYITAMDITAQDCSLEVYDNSTFPTDPCYKETDNIVGPSDIIVRGDVSYKPPAFSIVKDNNDPEDGCVEPFFEDNYLVFNIYWDANTHSDTNVMIIDYLPDDLDYYSSEPDANYNEIEHTVTWSLGNLTGIESDTFHITTKVKDSACSCRKLTNTAYLEGDNYCSLAAVDVNVCFLGGDIVYVDKDVNDPDGSNNGTNWQDAFSELQTALYCPPESFSSIWVAQGTYKPVYEIDDYEEYKEKSFELVNNLGLIGHFAGFETKPEQRNLDNENNETILDGLIETGKTVKRIVTAEGIDGALLDGFTIKSASQKGVYIDDSNIAIVNCEFLYNSGDGVYCQNPSGLDIHNCLFLENYANGLNVKDNDSNTIVSNCIFEGIEYADKGVYIENSSVELNHCLIKNHYDSGIYTPLENSSSNLTIKDCNIESNSNHGIYARNCSILLERSIIHNNGADGLLILNDYPATIINNWIHHNTGSGIRFIEPVSNLTFRNNTIFANGGYGIHLNMGSMSSEIWNCIIRENKDGDDGDFYGSFSNVNFCCLQDTHLGEYNIVADPDFINIGTDPNDLHISENSPCKDKGDSNDINDIETDIDGEGRIKYGKVDMGGDEYYWSPADFDLSGLVDFIDYAILANAFRYTQGNPNYVKKCDLEDNNCIDLADLELFCEDWLWQCAWETGWMMCMGSGEGMGGGLMLDLGQSLIARPQRLAERTDRFYAVDTSKKLTEAATFIEGKTVYIDENVIAEILAWLDKIWLSCDELRKSMTEEEFLEFRKRLEEDLLRFLKGD